MKILTYDYESAAERIVNHKGKKSPKDYYKLFLQSVENFVSHRVLRGKINTKEGTTERTKD
ncbi:MAG: hypothetical protein AB8F74_00995 [Saprospiraceae bacterium]